MAQKGALLQPSSQLGQTAPVGAQEPREAGKPIRGVQRPSGDLTFLSDSLMNSGMGSWPFEEVIMLLVEKKQLWIALCMFTQCQRDRQALLGTGATTGRTHFKELFIHRRS